MGFAGPVKTQYYASFDDDFVKSRHQDTVLPSGYDWMPKNFAWKLRATLLYPPALVFAYLYKVFGLHARVVNKKALRECNHRGFFLYGNHTQPMGDAFMPGTYATPKRIHVVVSPANLGIPVLGKVLPELGALPLPSDMRGFKSFRAAIQARIEQGRCVVIYPEAHVWPYCTFIRPFDAASFGYPATMGAPSYCMTTTYQPRRFGKKPRITAYIDGPFWPDASLPLYERKQVLCDQIRGCMLHRSKESTYSYISYEPEPQRADSSVKEII